MRGKNRCRILKEIRRRIAEENDITYITTECKYQGDCSGTCPKCESEVRYLERELERRRSLGYKVTVAGLAAGITLAAAGCTPDTTTGTGSRALMGDVMENSSEHSQEITESSIGDTTSTETTSTDISSEDYVDGDIEVIGEFPFESEDESEFIFESSDMEEVLPTKGDLAIP